MIDNPQTMMGMFVCDALNRLPHPEDLAEQQPFVELCCPECCAPCGALRDLDQEGLLDRVVQSGPEHLWCASISWMKDGIVNREWLYACWNQTECHEEV